MLLFFKAKDTVKVIDVIDCLVFYTAFNNFSAISQDFLGKLPVLLVHLS